MAHKLAGRLLARFRRESWTRVGKNTVALLAAQAGARALNLVLIALVTRALGAEGLGRYLMAMTVQTLALAVSDLGLSTYTTREFAREFAREDGPAMRGLWRTVLALRLAAALAAVLALNVLLAPFLPGRRGLLALVSLSLLPDAFGALATAWVKARQRMEASAAIGLGVRGAYLVAGALLLWQGYDERWLLGAYAGTSLLGALAFGLVLRRWTGEGVPFEGAREPRRGWREVLGESMPFAVTGVVAMVYARADLLLLSFYRGDAVAGRYGMAYRLWEAMGMIPASFLDALFPELSRLSGQGASLARLRALYRRGWQVVALGALLLSAATQVAATTLGRLLYGRTPDAVAAVGILRVLLFAFPFTYLYLLNGHALYAVGQQRRVTVAMAAITAAKLLLNALAVPRWGTWGAASVALACEGALFAWLQWLVWRSLLRVPGAGGREDCVGGRDDRVGGREDRAPTCGAEEGRKAGE